MHGQVLESARVAPRIVSAVDRVEDLATWPAAAATSRRSVQLSRARSRTRPAESFVSDQKRCKEKGLLIYFTCWSQRDTF